MNAFKQAITRAAKAFGDKPKYSQHFAAMIRATEDARFLPEVMSAVEAFCPDLVAETVPRGLDTVSIDAI